MPIALDIDSRGFEISVHADDRHRLRVQFNLKGSKGHAIQRVEPYAIRPLGYRARHRLWGRNAKVEPVAATASATNPSLPLAVEDAGDRVFVWTVSTTSLPRRGLTAHGVEPRVPSREELRVLIRIDDRRFFLKRAQPHERWAEPPEGSGT
jgi:hypothetical protein